MPSDLIKALVEIDDRAREALVSILNGGRPGAPQRHTLREYGYTDASDALTEPGRLVAKAIVVRSRLVRHGAKRLHLLEEWGGESVYCQVRGPTGGGPRVAMVHALVRDELLQASPHNARAFRPTPLGQAVIRLGLELDVAGRSRS